MPALSQTDFIGRQQYLQQIEEAAQHHAPGVLQTIRNITWAILRRMDNEDWHVHGGGGVNGMGRAVKISIGQTWYFLSYKSEWPAFSSRTNQSAVVIRLGSKRGMTVHAFNDEDPIENVELVFESLNPAGRS